MGVVTSADWLQSSSNRASADLEILQCRENRETSLQSAVRNLRSPMHVMTVVQRLSKLSDIDITQIPTDRVGLGSRVTVQDQVTEEKEIYELVFGDGGELIDGQVSMSSPIGLALQNKSVGEMVLLKLPARTRRLKIVDLVTFHQLDGIDS